MHGITNTNFADGDELELTDEPSIDPTLQASPPVQASLDLSEFNISGSESSGDGEVDEAKIASCAFEFPFYCGEMYLFVFFAVLEPVP